VRRYNLFWVITYFLPLFVYFPLTPLEPRDQSTCYNICVVWCLAGLAYFTFHSLLNLLIPPPIPSFPPSALSIICFSVPRQLLQVQLRKTDSLEERDHSITRHCIAALLLLSCLVITSFYILIWHHLTSQVTCLLQPTTTTTSQFSRIHHPPTEETLANSERD
jgi:hypothetical protein